MSYQSPHASPIALTTFPTELLLKIIFSLPSLAAAMPLLLTCRRFRALWETHAKTFYYKLNSDPCVPDALVLLNDHLSAALCAADLTARNVLCLSRYFQNAEKAMREFEERVVRKMRAAIEHPYSKTREHPPHLTSAERVRFTRAYYQLWSMTKLDASLRHERLKKMTERQLYFLLEMTTLKQRVGDEVPDFREVADFRKIIGDETRNMITDKHRTAYNRPAESHENIWWYFLQEFGGRDGHVVMFDHFQKTLRYIILDVGTEKLNPIFVREHLWDDSSDEVA